MSRTVLVLGGYGNAGARIAELLVRETEARVLIGGRQGSRAKLVADRLKRQYGEDRVAGVLADAADTRLLRKALEPVDLLVVASSTTQLTSSVAEAAVEARVDWFDIQSSTRKLTTLRGVRDAIERSGCCFITDGGLHPGMPGALVRFAAGFIDRPQCVRIAMLFNLDWEALDLPSETTAEFVDELREARLEVYERGEWVKRRSWTTQPIDFGRPFGKRSTVPLWLDEIESLPRLFPSLQDLSVWVGGFNWFVDYVAMGAGLSALRLFGDWARPSVARLFQWGLRRFSRPPWGSIMLVEAQGWKKGRLVEFRGGVSHRDGYDLTAIPAVAALLQYLDGSIRKPGLWQQALVVEPRRFMADLERLGATVTYDLDVQTGKPMRRDPGAGPEAGRPE
jgi:saccharopine dehydrogenase (NAD+, L-lysine-forming)